MCVLEYIKADVILAKKKQTSVQRDSYNKRN